MQDAHGMMDDSNWSTPLTQQAFKDATARFPIGEAYGAAWKPCLLIAMPCDRCK